MSDSVRIGSSLAHCSTKSPPLPAALSSSTMVLAFALIESSMRLTCRGVNAALTSLRRKVCSRRVHRQEGLGRFQQLLGNVLEEDPLAGQEHLVVSADRHDVVAPGQGPVPGVVGIGHQRVFDRRMPAHRAFGPQDGERTFPLLRAGGPERARREIDGVIGPGGGGRRCHGGVLHRL